MSTKQITIRSTIIVNIVIFVVACQDKGARVSLLYRLVMLRGARRRSGKSSCCRQYMKLQASREIDSNLRLQGFLHPARRVSLSLECYYRWFPGPSNLRKVGGGHFGSQLMVEQLYHAEGLQGRPLGLGFNIGTLIIRMGFGGRLYCNCNKKPPKNLF